MGLPKNIIKANGITKARGPSLGAQLVPKNILKRNVITKVRGASLGAQLVPKVIQEIWGHTHNTSKHKTKEIRPKHNILKHHRPENTQSNILKRIGLTKVRGPSLGAQLVPKNIIKKMGLQR